MVKVESKVKWNKGVAERLMAAARLNSVSAGIPEGLNYPNGQTVAAVALRQEFGTAKIPPRPFLRPCVDQRGKAWADHVCQVILKCNGREELKEMWNGVGEQMVRDIKGSIDRVSDPPLSPFTVKRRAAKGNPSTKPLIDTGKMRESIGYFIGKYGRDGGWN